MVKISALPPESTPTLTDSVPIYDPESGATKKTTLANVGVALGSGSSWLTLGYAPNTVTANGNRSYTLVFNSINLTGGTSPGQRLLLPRTVTAPTQCADLEASSSQYFSKTSPTGLAFTTTFTCSAWIKLESYHNGGIIARRNADTEGWNFSVESTGQIILVGLRVASNNKVIRSYQSLPLNKWVHVAATLDMAAGDTTAQKIWIDGVEVPRAYTLTGTATALVQGTTALTVGAEKSGGTFPFDGKIAQAAVFSAQLSDATIKAMMNQTMTGSETNLVSAFTLNNTLNDLSANANNLTANGGALATDTDTPFTNPVTGTSVTAGTTNYGIIMAQTFSTNTTYTIQIPEGETLPTTGGIGTVSYSTQKTPYGFPGSRDKWTIYSLYRALLTQAGISGTTYYNVGSANLSIPIGSWLTSFNTAYQLDGGSAIYQFLKVVLSTSTSVSTDSELEAGAGGSAIGGVVSHYSARKALTLTSATPYYLLGYKHSGDCTTLYLLGDRTTTTIQAENAYL